MSNVEQAISYAKYLLNKPKTSIASAVTFNTPNSSNQLHSTESFISTIFNPTLKSYLKSVKGYVKGHIIQKQLWPLPLPLSMCTHHYIINPSQILLRSLYGLNEAISSRIRTWNQFISCESVLIEIYWIKEIYEFHIVFAINSNMSSLQQASYMARFLLWKSENAWCDNIMMELHTNHHWFTYN